MAIKNDPSSNPKTEPRSFRIDPTLRVLLGRFSDAVDGKLNVVCAKAILEAAQPILPGKPAAALPLPKSARSSNALANVATICHSLSARIRKIRNDDRTYSIAPQVYMDLFRAAKAIGDGIRQPEERTPPRWLSLPEVHVPANASRGRLSILLTQRCAARLDLVAETRKIKVREAIEQCITEKLARHGADSLEAGQLSFTTFPPVPHLTMTRHFDDTAMPLWLVLANLGPRKNVHYLAAVEELARTLREHTPKFSRLF